AAAPEHLIQFVLKDADGVELVRWNRTREGEIRHITVETDACIPWSPRKAEHCQLIASYGQRCLSIRIVSAPQLAYTVAQHEPHPLKWSDLRYVSDIKEDCNGKEAIQA